VEGRKAPYQCEPIRLGSPNRALSTQLLSGIPRHDLSALRDNVRLSAKLEFELKPIRVVHRLANPGSAEAAIERFCASHPPGASRAGS
jgi:hypothetical protein